MKTHTQVTVSYQSARSGRLRCRFTCPAEYSAVVVLTNALHQMSSQHANCADLPNPDTDAISNYALKVSPMRIKCSVRRVYRLSALRRISNRVQNFVLSPTFTSALHSIVTMSRTLKLVNTYKDIVKRCCSDFTYTTARKHGGRARVVLARSCGAQQQHVLARRSHLSA